MRILLTNDDGYTSPGLKALEAALQGHELWIVAPERERSGQSHAITIKEPVRFHRVGEQHYFCSGTPADCVMFSLLGVLPERPDLIISGINLGANLGTDIIFSGTAAAARQGALMGVPSVAVSLNSHTPPFHFDPLARFVADNCDNFIDKGGPHHFININAPNETGYRKGFRITWPGRRRYQDSFVDFKAPNGDTYCFLTGRVQDQLDEGSDVKAVSDGYLSVSPVQVQPQEASQEVFTTEMFTLRD